MNRCSQCGHSPLDQARCPSCGHEPQRIGGFDAYAPELAASSEGFDARHHRVLAGLEAGNFWFRARNRLIVDALRRHAPALRAFLEIGCGTGFVLQAVSDAYPDADITGSELFVEGLDFASARVPGAHLIQMDARAIPYSGCFDATGAFDVIEHIDDDRKVLAEANTALVDGGILLLTVPQHMFLWSEQDEAAHHVRRYERQELVEKVTHAGFDVLEARSFVSLLLPLMLLSRKRPRESLAGHDPFREFKIAKWMNWALDSIMRLELRLMRLGIRFRHGGSLLVVARKAG